MAFSASMQHRAAAEMNITPLVDVMLVLLVIFMVSVPLLAEPVRAGLPQTSPINPPPLPHPALQLEIAADGAYRLDGRLLDPAGLQSRLGQALVEGDGRASLSVRASPHASYQALVTAVAAARDSGLRDIAVMP